jgi:PPM family protein phosphatase
MPHLHTCTQPGDHPKNEDAFLAQPHPLEPDAWLLFIADGMGGRPGGARAAQLACQSAISAASALHPDKLTHPKSWLPIFHSTDAAVSKDQGAGFTTLVAACVYKNKLAGASHGDSAALLLNHSSDPIDLTADQLKNPPLGSSASTPTPFSASLRSPWRLILMTDGVWKYAGRDTVTQLTSTLPPADAIAQLKHAAALPATGRFQDDFTLLLLESSPGHA